MDYPGLSKWASSSGGGGDGRDDELDDEWMRCCIERSREDRTVYRAPLMIFDATLSLRAIFSFLLSYLVNQLHFFFFLLAHYCESQPGNGFNSLNSLRENFAGMPCFILALDLSL